jgi:hypothetical protein
MVLQERIELSTSPLPRECSTTELLQHPGSAAPNEVGGLCHRRSGKARRRNVNRESQPFRVLLRFPPASVAVHRSRIARDATSTIGANRYSRTRRAPVFSSTVTAIPEVNG